MKEINKTRKIDHEVIYYKRTWYIKKKLNNVHRYLTKWKLDTVKHELDVSTVISIQ